MKGWIALTTLLFSTVGCAQEPDILRPNRDGEFVPDGFHAKLHGCEQAFQCVGEEKLNQSTYLYLDGATPQVSDDFFFLDVPGKTGPVDSLLVTLWVTQAESQGLVAPTLRHGNHVTLTPWVAVTDSVYAAYTAMFYKTPDGQGLTWTLLKTVEIGVEMVLATPTGQGYIRTAQMYAEAFD